MGGGGRGGQGEFVAGVIEHKSRHVCLYTAHCPDLFYKRVESHGNIPKGILIREHSSLINHEVKICQKVRVAILVRDTSA